MCGTCWPDVRYGSRFYSRELFAPIAPAVDGVRCRPERGLGAENAPYGTARPDVPAPSGAKIGHPANLGIGEQTLV